MTATGRDQNKLREDILQREPVEPARSPKQLYVTEWLAKHKKKKVRLGINPTLRMGSLVKFI